MATVADVRQAPLLTPPQVWQLPSALPSLRGARRIALDVETCDPQLQELGPGVRRGGYVAGIAVAVDGGDAWYLPVRHAEGPNLDEKLVWRWARRELNDFAGEVVGANLIYDLEYLAFNGVTLPRATALHDVQLAEPLLDEHRTSYSLESLARDYLGEGKVEVELREAAAAYGFHTSAEVKGNLWRLPAAYVGAYAQGDVTLPLRIFDRQRQRLEAEELTRVYDVERRLLPLLVAMRLRGVRVDVARAEEVRRTLVAERDAALREVRHLAGPRAELLAPDSFAPALLERGLDVPLTPKTRRPSITKAWLAANEHDELVRAIQRGRRVDTIINTFVDGAVLGHSVNGRVHCEFPQLRGDDGGTIARLASRNPNLQNVPARDPVLGPLIRGLFVPEEGEEWARLDLSQIEYRLLAHYAVGEGADEARRQYNENPETDFHKLCATLAGKDPEDKYVRKKIKNVNFCSVYGGGVPKIALTMGVPIEEATEFVDAYNERLPFVRQTLERAMRRAEQRGFVQTILGRRQRFTLWEDRWHRGSTPLPREQALAAYGAGKVKLAFTYAALNRVLQGSAADLLKQAMVDLWEAGCCDVLGAPLVTVHDELDLSVPLTPRGTEALMTVKSCMESAISLRVPVLAELERGSSWGTCE